MNPFIPAGYVTTEFAVMTLACARDPHLWLDIRAAEQRIWTSRSSPRLADLVAYMKNEQLSPEVRSRAAVRWRSYLSAAELVQQLLFSGNLTAWFLDEAKQMAFIKAQEWAGGERLTATLISGIDAAPFVADEFIEHRRLFMMATEVLQVVRKLTAHPKDNGRPAVQETEQSAPPHGVRGASRVPLIVAWLRTEYPNGWPVAWPRKSLLAKLNAAGIPGERSTLNRAINEVQRSK